MKKLLLLFGFMSLLGFASANATDNVQKKSSLGQETTPLPFNPESVTQTSPAISTGYYFVDSRETTVPDFWRINPEIVSLETEPQFWKRIMSGPRQVDSLTWNNNPEGLAFFRNPAVPLNRSYFRPGATFGTDSTNNAIAGPIPLGLAGGFYFNGLRYDSFYVSTNGVIALTNRRYFYNGEGARTTPPGATSAYDPMSMDWFAVNRARLADDLSMTDPMADNFGYEVSVLGGLKNTATAGIRANGPADGMDGFEQLNKAALIAPFWGKMQFVQWDKFDLTTMDFSQVWYKKSLLADKLIIYIQNIQPEAGVQQLMGSQYTAPINAKMGFEFNYVDASAQVVLNRLDSSVTIQYERFRGGATLDNNARPGAAAVMQAISVAGVRGFARHVNYDGVNAPANPWAENGEYIQTTHYNKRIDPRQEGIYGQGVAVRFKQYKNTLRVINTKYYIRKASRTANNDFVDTVASVDNYELLAGDEKLGAIQPVITIQNLTNQIQGIKGVNFTPQDLSFRARITIENDATSETVYSETVSVTDAALSDTVSTSYQKVRLYDPWGNNKKGVELPYLDTYSGVPPYKCVQVSFKPFIPREEQVRNIGRLKVSVIADPTDPFTKEGLGDQWPFDDTSKIKLWVIKRLSSFKDDVSEFNYIEDTYVPSVMKWVNLGVVVESGDKMSIYPLAPRGEFEDVTKKARYMESPIMLMNRVNSDGSEWDADNNPKSADGDELRSFPIDLNGMVNPVLTLSVQRSVQSKEGTDRSRGFSDKLLVGPEPRVVLNNGSTYPLFQPNQYPNINPAERNVCPITRYVDELRVDFALPSVDGVKEITNISDANWRTLKKPDGTNQADVSAYTLYGGGGYALGFLEENPETEEIESDTVLTTAQGLRIDPFDDGFDWDYKKIFIRIPSYFLNATEEIKKNFRFRFKVMAFNHFLANQRDMINTIPDDNDDFIVDNVAIIAHPTEADVEVSSVKIKWPYTAVPASQALDVPISVLLSNNASMDSKAVLLRTFITRGFDTVYCTNLNITKIPAGQTLTFNMPAWNARITGPGRYRIHSHAHYVGNAATLKDIDPSNDYNYNDFDMRFSNSFSYESNNDVTTATNDVEKTDFLNMVGRGLNIRGYKEGGVGTATGYTGGFDYVTHAGGAFGGDGSGQIAVKFTLSKPDTIYGYQAYFAAYNIDNSGILFSVYADNGNGLIPTGTPIANTTLEKIRGVDDITGESGFNKYSTYILSNPVLLPTGTYWATIAQRGNNGLELGAKAERMGMRTTMTSIHPQTAQLGLQGVNLLIDKSLREINPSDGGLYNNNIFAYQNGVGTGSWIPFMNSVGNPAYAHLEHFGLSLEDRRTYTFTRGTWLPMLRPYFGEKTYGEERINIPCPAPVPAVPVELNEFNAHSRNNGIEVFWATASEQNNKGFYVERADENNNEFKSIGFVEGNGNSFTTKEYSYFDKNVVNANTYTYRLRQVDYDGSNCETYSQEVKVKYVFGGDVVLEANAPNPFTTSTNIAFRISETSNVKLEVLDMFGSVVTTLVNGELSSNRHVYNWNGTTENGNLVAPGTYVYRLTVNGTVYNSKMTVIR